MTTDDKLEALREERDILKAIEEANKEPGIEYQIRIKELDSAIEKQTKTRKIQSLEDFINNSAKLDTITEEFDNFLNDSKAMASNDTPPDANKDPIIDLDDSNNVAGHLLRNETQEQYLERCRAEKEIMNEFKNAPKIQRSPTKSISCYIG